MLSKHQEIVKDTAAAAGGPTMGQKNRPTGRPNRVVLAFRCFVVSSSFDSTKGERGAGRRCGAHWGAVLAGASRACQVTLKPIVPGTRAVTLHLRCEFPLAFSILQVLRVTANIAIAPLRR
jgi:hypothetical protein